MRYQLRPIISIIGIPFLLLGLCATALPQTEPVAGAACRGNNDRSNRCEGIVSFQASLPPIELIAFYGFCEPFSDRDILKVKFYLHTAPQLSDDVYLTAQELIRRKYYWMEAKPRQWTQGWNEFAPWPVREVLGKLKIGSDNLGVLVRLTTPSGSRAIAPAILYHSSPPAQIAHYKAYFKPAKPLAGGEYQLYKECAEDFLIQKGQIGKQDEGTPFLVKFELPTNWQGWVKLKIIYHIPGMITNAPLSFEYCFFHVP